MAIIYGAYVTIKYWCPNMFDDSILEDMTGEDLVRDLLDEAHVINFADDNGTLVAIECVPMTVKE